MIYYTYVIFNRERNKMYIGQTSDVSGRLKRHNGLLKNKAKSYTSKNPGTWKLVYKEAHISREDAVRREKQLKSYRGREFIKKLMKDRGAYFEPPGAPIA